MDWQLPGPRRFLESIIDDIAAGVAVVVGMPAVVSSDQLRGELEHRVPHLRLETLDLSQADYAAATLVTVARQLRVDAAATPATADELAATDMLDGTLLWISTPASLAPARRDALMMLAQQLVVACEEHGGVCGVVVCQQAGPEVNEIPGDARLRVHLWSQVVSRLDCAVRVRTLAAAPSHLSEAVTVELAGTDLELAERLVTSAAPDGTATWDICRDRALELGLDDHLLLFREGQPPRRTEAGRAWAAGAFDYLDGEPYWHTGVLVLARQDRLLARRSWAGQTRSLLPRLDLLRGALVDVAVEHGLIALWQVRDGAEIEFRELSLKLSRSRDIPPEVGDLARWLQSTRNHLAHLQVVSADSLREGRRLAHRAGYPGLLD